MDNLERQQEPNLKELKVQKQKLLNEEKELEAEKAELKKEKESIGVNKNLVEINERLIEIKKELIEIENLSKTSIVTKEVRITKPAIELISPRIEKELLEASNKAREEYFEYKKKNLKKMQQKKN